MKYFPTPRLAIICGLLLAAGTSCVSLKPYEKVYVNDPEMQMSASSRQNFHNYIQSIREGSTSPAGTKSSGGCGCN